MSKFFATVERGAMVTLRSKYSVEAADAEEAERLVRAEDWNRIILEADELVEVHLANPPDPDEKMLIEELP
jgi:hypothetical protein